VSCPRASDHHVRASILHWNRPTECLATVAALRTQGVPLQLTIIDNQSSAESLRVLEAGLPADVELIRLPENVGWGRAHNLVLRRWIEQESSRFCVIGAHDALPQQACLTRLMEALEEHPDWGMACPEYGRSEITRYGVLRGVRLRKVSPRPNGTHEEVEYCHGTLAVFRRECVREIGPFDERFFAYGDETEIGLRARRAGWKVGLVWGAVVVNPGSSSDDAVIGYLWTRSSLRLARALGGPLGLSVRLLYVVFVTGLLWLMRAPVQSLSSPAARWRAIRDYLSGYCGPPPGMLSRRREHNPQLLL
jgi:N-acetylglucosaminyl-diphospho-decaprenol L-rhamnosyltransferase